MTARRALAAAAAVGAGTLALGAGAALAVTGNTVIVGEDQAPESLNQVSLGGATVVTHRVMCPVQCENLLNLTTDFKYVPVLASTVPSIANGGVKLKPFFTVTFKIRPDAAWSDGQPVTSTDVRFTWQTMVNPRFKAAGRTGWDRISAVRTPDPKTAVIVFKGPYAPWRDIYSPSGGGILLPAHILRGQDFNTVWSGKDVSKLIGTGPYVLQSYKSDDAAVLVPNTRYWRGVTPKVERIVFSFLKSTQGQDVAYQNKEINFFNTPAFALVPQFRKFADTTVQNPPGVTWEHLQFNSQDPVMKDVNVRKAVAYAIDPGELIRRSAGNQVFPLDSVLVPEQAPFYRASWGSVNRNAGLVAKHLRAAGYTKQGGKWVKDGKQLVIHFVTISGNTTREGNFKLMKRQLESLGIGFKSTFDDNFFDQNGSLNTGRFQVAEAALQTSADPSVTTLFRSDYIPTTASPAGQNTFRYASRQLDALLDGSDKAVDVPSRIVLMRKVQDHLARNMVVLPLYQRPEVVVHASNLKGVLVNPTQVGITDRAEGWSFTGGRAIR
ncbi:MAG: peptide ABC transporter substrate-binding protein [Actinomycetota bacterium]